MARDVVVRTASGAVFIVPGVRTGHEWRLVGELTRLLGEDVVVVEDQDK